MHLFAEEWPLMMFTLLSQFAVGTFITMIFISNFMRKKGENNSISGPINTGLLVVLLVMGLSLLSSLFHLGTPLGAYRAINNFATSWLSREIVFAGLFFVLTIVTYYFYKKESDHPILGMLTAIVGLLVIYSMASLYSSSIRPAWDNINTYIAFFSTTFLFGTTGSALIIFRGIKKDRISYAMQYILKNVSLVAVCMIIVQIVFLPVFIVNLHNGGAEAQESLQLLSKNYGLLLIVRWILSIIGIVLLMYIFYKPAKELRIPKANFIVLAFTMIFIGEFIGRYIFYAIAVSIGIG